MSDCEDYAQIFLNDIPLIDTRAPIEFAKGSFAHATNLPLMTDKEREQVGTCYKQQGQEAAITLGHQLVSGATKEQRVKAWQAFANANPQGMLFCFRGGLRSKISQEWLKEAGTDYPRVAGGYKAMRTFLINTLESAAAECNFVQLGGLTGTGKTDLLLEIKHGIDLEGHANHRGSSFGKHATSQPTQINFENNLAVDFLKKRHAGINTFVVENEGKLVGACTVPLPLRDRVYNAPVVILEEDIEHRVERILRDYVVDLRVEFLALDAEQGDQAYCERLQRSLSNIKKRLGGERYQRLSRCLDDALALQLQSGQVDAHRGWIQTLLEEYYDPMYHYQEQQLVNKPSFRGNFQEVKAYLNELIL